MKIEQIHETFEPSLSLNKSGSSSTLSSSFRRTQKSSNHQISREKTSFDTTGSSISAEISDNEQIKYRHQKSVNNHHLLLSMNQQEPDIKIADISEVDDVNECRDISLDGKSYLFDELFKSENDQRKQFSLAGNGSTAEDNILQELTDECSSLASNITLEYMRASRFQCENTNFTSDVDTELNNRIANGNQRVSKIIKGVKSSNKHVKKQTTVKNMENRQPQWDSYSPCANKFKEVSPVVNTKKVIRDVYLMNKKMPEVKIKNNVKRNHLASSLINRNKMFEEIKRINKIISNNIINVRSTIPKMKR